ncbi:hypothetical protein D9611_006888 [Ephemerocybe angulata]|uniref:PHD-type domain-containing protein n=1 Tax=Ephemerocybe angulata TaxID=980116 RepID=A0A8H5B0M6_9AGAR|nr:hypothetical protein D9611_006888 [Tulosesus angulatus]
MSRRLDISALLCNDDDDQPPVHNKRPSSSASPVVPRRLPPPPAASSSTFVGFDALVHAANEERRRLSGGELAQPQHRPQHHQPQQMHHQQHAVYHHHQQQPPPPRLSPQFHRSPWEEDQQYSPPSRQPQSPRHPDRIESPIDGYKSPPQRHSFDERSHHQMRQFQLVEQQKRQHEHDRMREMERQRLEQERLAEIERTKIERQKMEEERRLLEEDRMRLLKLERRLQEQEAARRREDEEREERRRQEEERRQQDEERRREREVAAIREAERREHQRQQAEIQLQRKHHEEVQQQRLYDMQRVELERQRRQQQQAQLHQQQLAQQQQQRQEQQQQQRYAFHQHQQHQQPPQQQRNYEPPPRIEIPPGPQHPVRKLDQSPPSSKPQSQSPVLSHAHPDQRPAKKARYSDSPSLPPILMDDKDRIARERERMTVGEIGYGRIESPVAMPPSSSSSSSSVPRRPGSGNGVRRPVSVSDLLSPEPQPPLLPTPIEPHHPPLRIISREKDPAPTAHHHHRILSPLGRRSPPGSQVGRAKAARKSDEHGPSSSHAIGPSVSTSSTSSTSLPGVTLSQPPPPPSSTLPAKKPVVKEEHVGRRQKIEDLPSPSLMEAPRKTPAPNAVTRESPSAPLPPPPPSAGRQSKERPHHQHGDAHDWLLEHYAQPSPPLKKDHHRHAAPRATRSPSIPTQRRTASPVVQVKKQSPSPVIQDEDDNALEQELEELLAEVDTPAKEESMDVDSVVAELVAETLGGDDEEDREEVAKSKPYQQEPDVEEPMPLAADVEDELLSLIDDKLPPPPSSSSAARRTSLSSSAAPTPTPRLIKPPPQQVKTLDSGLLPATTSNSPISALLSPIVRAEKPKSERGSMPPPPTVVKKDQEGKKKDVVDGAVPASAAAASKKKKDAAATKKPKGKATVADSNSTPTDAALAKPRAKASKPKKVATSATTANGETGSPAPTPPPVASTSSSKPTSTFPKPANAATTTASRKNTSVSATSRSRSTSAMPVVDDVAHTPASSVPDEKVTKAEKQEEEEDSDAANEDDNRLYCVCKTKYDQERCMIACDRCDEWYHMQCVDMPEIVADLVDQFFCPLCIEKNPGLNLRSTYKQRCLWGLKSPDPSSPRACHKPARGAFSKYCSDECGVKYMQSRIDTWAKKGGKKEKLWDSVKGADKREGVVVRIEDDDSTSSVNGCTLDSKPDGHLKNGLLKPAKPMKSKAQREKERLSKTLEQLLQMTAELKKGMDVLGWREKLLELAGDRADSLGQCGWDQRMCYGDEEWVERGQAVIESYEDRGEADMDVDGQSESGDGEWWCTEDAACSRHMGWQTTRYKDICKEKENKEEALQKLTSRETDIRKQLEDIANPQLKKSTGAVANSHQDQRNASSKPTGPLASANPKLSNGHATQKGKSASGELKKGKKRKAPAS